MSKGTYNCSTWPPLLKSSSNKFHSAILNMYRAAVGNYYTKDSDNTHLVSDDEIIFSHGFLSPQALIRLSRVSLFLRVIKKQSKYVAALIQAMSHVDRGWVSAIKEDLSLLATHEEYSHLALMSLPQVMDLINQDPKYHYRHIRKVLRLPYFSIDMSDRIEKSDRNPNPEKVAVSYTHLTLPTKRIV